jgi:predicted nucleotidyltransferase
MLRKGYMTNTSVKLLKPISEKQSATLYRVLHAARTLKIPTLLCGAFARDLLFWHMHGIDTQRATLDMDVSIQVNGWGRFESMRQALIKSGFSNPNPTHPEKLQDPATSIEVDLLPFGEISEDGKTIIWREDNSKWSVIGFDDALTHSLELDVSHENQTETVALISAPSLVMLKIIATHDRPEDRYKKDAADIGFIINNYRNTLTEDPLRTHDGETIMESVEGDLDLAVAMYLGYAIANFANHSVVDYLLELLNHEMSSSSKCYLARGLQKNYCEGDFSRARELLKAMADGLEGIE